MSIAPDRRRNRIVAASALSVVIAMVGLAYASVPLYRLFCQATGFGGTTQRAEEAPGAQSERSMGSTMRMRVRSSMNGLGAYGCAA